MFSDSGENNSNEFYLRTNTLAANFLRLPGIKAMLTLMLIIKSFTVIFYNSGIRYLGVLFNENP